MSNGTLKTKNELISLLADNNTKAISAADVQSIVKSNYQPVMIFTGAFIRDEGNNNNWNVRTNYYNPDFFKPRATGISITGGDQIWRFTNRGSVLIANHTYENVVVTPTPWSSGDSNPLVTYASTPALFNLYTNSAGNVDRYDILSSGSGWWGPHGTYNSGSGNWQYRGQFGTMTGLAGAGITTPTVEFIGPVVWKSGQASNPEDATYILSTNTNLPSATIPGQGASSNHTFLNTLVQHSRLESLAQADNSSGALILATASNNLFIQAIRDNTSDPAMQVSLWRMPS